MDSPYPVDFNNNLDDATHYMKTLANRHRLIVMCKIAREPHTVSELVQLTGMSQPALSLHLSKLRDEDMVNAERRGKCVYYTISNPKLAALVEHVCYHFQCWGEPK